MDQRRLQAANLVLASGIVTAVAAFLPWARVTLFLGTVDVAGTDGDGKLTLVLGGAIAVCGLVMRNGTNATLLAVLTGLVVLGTGIYDWATLDSGEGEEIGASVSSGVGLWLTVLGGAGSVLAAFMYGRAGEGGVSPASPAPPPPPAP